VTKTQFALLFVTLPYISYIKLSKDKNQTNMLHW